MGYRSVDCDGLNERYIYVRYQNNMCRSFSASESGLDGILFITILPFAGPTVVRTAGGRALLKELSFALKMADTADEIAMSHFGHTADVQVKADNSLLTLADTKIDQALTGAIRATYPKDVINAEESERGVGRTSADRLWAIDPIDHTNNFARGLDVFGTLISLLVDGQPVVGVASAPAVGKRWWAAKGHGAYANGQKIRVSRVSAVRECHFTYSHLSEWNRLGRLQAMIDLESESRWSFGSGGFTGQMWVAEGKLDVSLDSTGYVWDLAAPKIIVEEAGGRFTSIEGQDSAWMGNAIATNGVLHDEVLRRVATI